MSRYPQNTDTGVLKTFITQQGVKSASKEEQAAITSQVMSRVTERRNNVRKKVGELERKLVGLGIRNGGCMQKKRNITKKRDSRII